MRRAAELLQNPTRKRNRRLHQLNVPRLVRDTSSACDEAALDGNEVRRAGGDRYAVQ